MTDYVRRLVSGGKARFKDDTLRLELDLVYVTDQVIIMGYPAIGVEGLYRNRREDAKKFLDHRHGDNYWIFNFCPVRENSYEEQVFEGRVSRYPFPDHHAPPLAILPLVTREIASWLSVSKDRVAVLHCKAGKGRSGTLACAYLLSLDIHPQPPQLKRNYNNQEWAQKRAEDQMDVIPEDIDDLPSSPVILHERTASPDPIQQQQPHHITLDHVLHLHTSRRMKPPASPSEKQKSGVSIPSQRRWLSYWSLLLSNQAPPGFGSPQSTRRVRVTSLTVNIRESSSLKMNLVRAANTLIETAGKAQAHTTLQTGTLRGQHMWASLARYNDDFVQKLDEWEKTTRDEDNLGRSRPHSTFDSLFKDDTWDGKKMVRSFARMSAEEVPKGDNGKEDNKLHRYVYKPVSSSKWSNIRQAISQTPPADTAPSDSSSTTLSNLKSSSDPQGIILHPDREVRIKLYLGQIFLTWMWFIPAFHLSPDTPRTTLLLSKEDKQLDFALGVGAGIVDVAIDLEWVQQDESAATKTAAPEPASLPASHEPSMDTGLVGAAVEAVVGGGVREATETKQAVQN